MSATTIPRIVRILRAAAALPLALVLAGCPLQTPLQEGVSAGLLVTASAGAPLVGDTLTLTVTSTSPGDVSNAQWQTSDASVVTLASTTGATVMATAAKVGTATLTVTQGALRGSVTISVLSSVADVDLSGPTSFAFGQTVTYTAAVTDDGGHTLAAPVAWVANGSVELVPMGSNTGASMKVQAKSVGAGAITAKAGGRTSQIAVKVTATSGSLVITRSDGTPVGDSVSSTDTLTVEASYQVTNEPALDAQWTSSGACSLVGSSGSTLSVMLATTGPCMLTAKARGMQAIVSFTVVAVDGVAISGDTMTALALGETRTFTAKALSGTSPVAGAAITWTVSDATVLAMTPSGASVTVKGVGVGTATLKAATALASTMASLSVAPTSIQITASSARVVTGGSVIVTARALGPQGLPGPFTTTDGLSLAGATGFASAVVGALTSDGGVTFFLTGAKGDSPSVTVSLGAVVSNHLSFSLATIASVMIMGPQGPVRVGSTVDLTAIALDDAGDQIDGSLETIWTDSAGVYTFPADHTLHVTANVVKLGTSAIVATVMGVASPAFASPAQPAMLGLTVFTPASIAIGAKATAKVTVLDAMGATIPGATLAQVSLSADDATKVSFDAGSAVSDGFVFTATGLAATAAGGTQVTATWTDGMYPIMSGSVPLVVTGP